MLEKIKKYGFCGAIFVAAKVLGNRLGIDVLKMHYLCLKTDITDVQNKLKDFDLNVKPLSLEDFKKGDPNVFKGEKMKLYSERFKDASYYAYGIEEDNRLIYSTWFTNGSLGLPIVSKKYPLLPNEGVLEDSYCDPIGRGRGFHSKMNLFRIKSLYELGCDRVLAIVLDGNTPAMKVQMKCGFRELGFFYVGSIFGFKFCTLYKKKFDKK